MYNRTNIINTYKFIISHFVWKSIYICKKLNKSKTERRNTLYNIIKSRMAALGIKNVDLIREISTRYMMKLNAPDFSAALTATYKTPKQERIMKYVEIILAEKEAEEKEH